MVTLVVDKADKEPVWFVTRSGDEDEDAEPENCAAPLTCKEKDLLRYYYYIHNGIATKYVAGWRPL